MYGYQRPGPTQRTNSACNRKICELLGVGKSLEVFARVQERSYKIGSFVVSEAAALEDAVIRDLNPLWNRSGKTNGMTELGPAV
jgi:hypothetical protein